VAVVSGAKSAPIRRWRNRLRNGVRRARLHARWLCNEVPRDPTFEFYARGQDRADRAVFLADRARGAAAVEGRFAPFGGAEIPRVIWMYWHQGEAQAPFVVRRCIESWRRHNPGWKVRVLDAESVAGFADMSDVPEALSFRYFADLLRVRLLARHGGVWADATVWCHRPLDDWLPLMSTTGFFALRHPGVGRWISSWFLVSAPGHMIPTLWAEAFTPYMRRLRYVPDMYFVFFYLLQWRLKKDPEAMAAWTRAPSLPAQPSLFMMEALRGTLPVDRLRDVLDAGTPVSKLTWKEIVDESAFDAFCAGLDGPGSGGGGS
jgi:hypothetical protein